MADGREQQERVQKLEESQGFVERTVEELAAEVRELGKLVHELGVKLSRLESRMEAQQRAQEEGGESEQE